MSAQFIVIYRPHDRLQLETTHIGPFDSFEEADDLLCNLPAVGSYDGDGNSGVKYVQELVSLASDPATRFHALAALTAAEQFMTGFEGDETQEGIDAKLESIRAAIAKIEARP